MNDLRKKAETEPHNPKGIRTKGCLLVPFPYKHVAQLNLALLKRP